jgi:dephospho-CoA kinase
MERDKSNKEDAQSRLSSQMPVEEKTAFADYIIDNSGPLTALERQIHTMVLWLQKESGWTWRVAWIFPPIGILFAARRILQRRSHPLRAKL